MKTTKLKKPATSPASNGSAAAQDGLDWQKFRQHFVARKGYEPSTSYQSVKDAFYFFTAGAHEEHMGRLTPPNVPDQRPGGETI